MNVGDLVVWAEHRDMSYQGAEFEITHAWPGNPGADWRWLMVKVVVPNAHHKIGSFAFMTQSRWWVCIG